MHLFINERGALEMYTLLNISTGRKIRSQPFTLNNFMQI